MKKLLNKKNNKGFSLVELIVVVLIMGIIAVALAPQVMKWVDKAKTNSDANTAKDIKSALQIAVADAKADGVAVPTVTSKNYDATDVATLGSFATYVTEVTGGDYSAKTSAGGKFTFSISSAGVVTVSYPGAPTT
ncbi:MAG: type II secretion system protein [Lachnospiraceae bacterium]|nr:type II secretion system protein [Lachnospiraceae bacterium]